MIASAPAADAWIEIPLEDGWEVSRDGGPGIPARVPGTAATAFHDLETRHDAHAYTFHCSFEAERAGPGEQLVLRLGGIATISEVFLNGESILKSDSMFKSHEIDVTRPLRDRNELRIECRPLAAALREKRSAAPAARWRTRVVSEPQLRWFRTTLLGRAPGFAPEPEPVGPWRPVTLVRRRAAIGWTRRVELDGSTGVVTFEFESAARGRAFVGDQSAEISDRVEIRIPRAKLWWPHTHGDPALYPVRLEIGGMTIEDVPAGFRSWTPGAIPDVFCRGVVWTPLDPVSLQASEAQLRARLETLRDGGYNMVRLAGTMLYESDMFHRLCDELGLMVWQDLMFANMDYPFEDAGFGATARAEAETELARISRHASTAVVCGNSEIEQQASMMGIDPTLARGAFFGEEVPRIAARVCPGVAYIPSAPCGGDLPFRTNQGVANYFGVGAYLRPMEDARRADVKFASECLAFANVPEPEMVEKMSLATRGGISPTHPAWKRGVPRDCGAGWDFEDVRDHYLKLLYGVDPAALRHADPQRYWELSRIVTGEVMAEVFGEWRREASPCGGGIVLWGADLMPGAGWGVLDSEGRPKAAYWFLKRTLAPCAVWMTDEGLNGIAVHVANDRPVSLDARLRVAIYKGEHKVDETVRAATIPARGALMSSVEEMLGRFVDVSYSYRFGPPGHDMIVATLEQPFSQAFRFPVGRPMQRAAIDELGMNGETSAGDGAIEVTLRSKRFAWGVRVAAPGYLADDAYFGIEPGGERRIRLRPIFSKPGKPIVTALNAEGRLTL